MLGRRRLRSSRITAGAEASIWRRWTIPTIGAVTPVGLIVVNIAAFIVHHLSSFQWLITILAFVSGMMLNSWAGINLFRRLRARFPEHPLFVTRNEEFVLVAGMFVIIVASFLTALFCFRGLSNEADLPNNMTFLTGVIAIAIPILLQALFRRDAAPPRRGGRRPYHGEVSAYPPPRAGGPPHGPYAAAPAPQGDPRDARPLGGGAPR